MDNGYSLRRRIAAGVILGTFALGAAGCGRGSDASGESPTVVPALTDATLAEVPTGAADTAVVSQQSGVTDAEIAAVKEGCTGEASGTVIVKTIDKNKDPQDPITYVRMDLKDNAPVLEGDKEDGSGEYEPVMTPHITRDRIPVIDFGDYNCSVPQAVFRGNDYIQKTRNGEGKPVTAVTPIYIHDKAFVQ